MSKQSIPDPIDPSSVELKELKAEEQLPTDINSAMVRDLLPILESDFDEGAEVVQGWLSHVENEEQKGYLLKILDQLRLVQGILLSADAISEKNAEQVITLWKQLKAPNLISFLDKLVQEAKPEPGPFFNNLSMEGYTSRPPIDEPTDKDTHKLLVDGSWVSEEKGWHLKAGSTLKYSEPCTTASFWQQRPTDSTDSKLPTELPYGSNLLTEIDIQFIQFVKELPILIQAAIISINQGCPKLNILKIEINVNPRLWFLCTACWEILGTHKYILWYGTQAKNVIPICKEGFRKEFNPSQEYQEYKTYGPGTHLIRSSMIAFLTGHARLEEGNLTQVAILAFGTLGRTAIGNDSLVVPPRLPSTTSIGLFRAQSTVDQGISPGVFCTPDHYMYPAVVLTTKHK